jgi:hypothetical protein
MMAFEIRPKADIANLTNRHTRRAYQNPITDFMQFTGIARPEECPLLNALSLPW